MYSTVAMIIMGVAFCLVRFLRGINKHCKYYIADEISKIGDHPSQTYFVVC